jgi:hypothetical protein
MATSADCQLDGLKTLRLYQVQAGGPFIHESEVLKSERYNLSYRTCKIHMSQVLEGLAKTCLIRGSGGIILVIYREMPTKGQSTQLQFE